MFKTLLLICLIAFSGFVHSQTLCVKYANMTGLTQTALITNVVVGTVTTILQDNTAGNLRRYFDGSYTVKTNFTDPANTIAYNNLAGKLVSFFYTALGCDNGSVPLYTGNVVSVHTSMNITYADFTRFNLAVIQTLLSAGVSTTDAAAIANAINIRGICSSTDNSCTSVCNNYSIPYSLNNSALVGAVVTKTVNAALGSAVLKPFFDGTTPTGSTNFTDPSNAGKFKNLFDHLVQFFGVALGCSDGSIPMYSGSTNLKAVHSKMPINKAAFEGFNNALVAQMQSLGVQQGDLNAVATLLAGTKADICNQPDCAVGTSMSGSSMGGSSMGGSSMGASSNGVSSNGVSSNGVSSNVASSNVASSNGGMTSVKVSSTTNTPSTTGNAFTLIFSVVALFVTLLI